MNMLSVVIIEYHCIDDVINALKSVEKHLSDIDWQAIVVSNSEYDIEGEKSLKEALPNALIIVNDVNGGYAGGVNRAIKEIDSPYIFLLNPDGEFIDDGIEVLFEDMKSDPDVAIIGPKVIDDNGIVQPSCRRFPRPYTFLLCRSFLNVLPGASKERARYFMEDYDRIQKRDVDWVSGGAMLIRTKAIKDIGGMDERYFLYMEDVDWCKQARKKGWGVSYNPAATILHAGRHESIDKGIMGVFNKTTRWHLSSLFKYFIKWGYR